MEKEMDNFIILIQEQLISAEVIIFMSQCILMQKNRIYILPYIKINLVLIKKLEQLLLKTTHLSREILEKSKKGNITLKFGRQAGIGIIQWDPVPSLTNCHQNRSSDLW